VNVRRRSFERDVAQAWAFGPGLFVCQNTKIKNWERINMATRQRTHVSEDLLAKLARAAYLVALKHGFRGPFVDVELELWRTLDAVVREEQAREHTPTSPAFRRPREILAVG
jgi:hypothetical protein